MRTTNLFLFILLSINVFAQQKTTVITLLPEQAKTVINKNIYGQFAEHLGAGIYGSIWVGKNSPIPNSDGYRSDVLQALKDLQIPVLRWPGGCFADEYHWIDGIGNNRPKIVNNNWGAVVEDNSFGTHEFLNLCEILGCEPYVSGNVGSGTVSELAKWVEYMTSDGDSPMANLRRQNGREKSWKVKYLGIGNESWGCGGNMTSEYYSDQFLQFSTFCRNFGENKLFKIAVGPYDYELDWTETLMKRVGKRMDGLSLHYYTVKGWDGSKGSATQFSPEEYYNTIGKSVEIDDVLQKQTALMDKYDSEKQISLMVDEWGTWFDVEPGTNPGFLFQQNTMRDALVAALSFNIMHKFADRVQMANIAQMVNVLQAMILTKDDKMLLTPTYHVFYMYKVHQNALNIPLNVNCETKTIRERQVPVVSATASQKDGKTHISLINIDLENSQNININLGNIKTVKISGKILTSKNITDHNTFENPNIVQTSDFKDFKLSKNLLSVNLPAKAIVTLELQ